MVTIADVQSLKLSVTEKLELLELLQKKDQRQRENWLLNYKPYAKQLAFHAQGKDFRERLFLAGNQLGKTFSGAAEIAYHATGRYPKDWKGRRFARPVSILAGSESAELTRKGVQRLLLGPPQKREEWGTGSIPKDCLVSTTLKSGVPDAVASIVVKNEFGGESVIQFNSYDQGRSKWQADTVDVVWFDEEPPEDIYFEGLTRTNATGGIVFVTFTPLLGMSAVVKRFLVQKPEGTATTTMTIEDAEHYTAAERAAIIATYPEHEREARARGIPIMGSGVVFPVAESVIRVDPFPIPPHWARINGIDFGIDHPAAFVCLAHDRDTDTVYVYDAWKLTGKQATAANMSPIMMHAGMIAAKGYQHIPHAWPHDGLQRDKASGEQLKEQYKKHHINMLGERATFEDGTNGVEAGLSLMLERFQTRRLRVFSHLEDWFAEFRLYHRKDGLVVKIDDDLMSATRYATMMLRFAKSLAEIEPIKARRFGAPIVQPFEVFNTDAGY